jgi:2-iminobutanoate/2-iminopropanoate deaminase
MSREGFVVDGLAGPFGPYAHVVRDGEFVLTSGIGPHHPDGIPAEPAAWAARAFENLETALAAAGAMPADVLRLTVLAEDLAVALPVVNAEMAARFALPHPARTVLQAGLPGVPLVLDAVAVVRSRVPA